MVDATSAVLMWSKLGAFTGLQDDETLQSDFEQLDANGDGKLSASELRLVLRRIAPGARDAGICYHMLDLADSNGDGFIDLDEYRSLRQATTPAQHMSRYTRRWGI